MSLINTLCRQLGLSHHQLAAFLAIDRSQLSRSELGLRPFPAEAMENLLELYMLYQQLPAPVVPISGSRQG